MPSDPCSSASSTEIPAISTAATTGGQSSTVTPCAASASGEHFDLLGADALGGGRDLGADRRTVVGERGELHGQHCAPRVAAHLPERPERLPRLQRAVLVREGLFGAAPERREEQVVHRAEVVVHECGTHAGDRRDSPRAHRRVARLEHELLGGVEQRGAGLGRLGAQATGCDHGARVRRWAIAQYRRVTACRGGRTDGGCRAVLGHAGGEGRGRATPHRPRHLRRRRAHPRPLARVLRAQHPRPCRDPGNRHLGRAGGTRSARGVHRGRSQPRRAGAVAHVDREGKPGDAATTAGRG